MTYALSVTILILTIGAFFALARGHFGSFGAAQAILRIIVAIPLLVSGILLHFFRMHLTASIIPPAFPARTFLVVLTGVLEIAGAIGLFVPRVRHAAALCIAIMMVAVFPANIYAAGQVIDGLRMPSVPVRLAMQIVYIVLVLLAGYGNPQRAAPPPS